MQRLRRTELSAAERQLDEAMKSEESLRLELGRQRAALIEQRDTTAAQLALLADSVGAGVEVLAEAQIHRLERAKLVREAHDVLDEATGELKSSEEVLRRIRAAERLAAERLEQRNQDDLSNSRRRNHVQDD